MNVVIDRFEGPYAICICDDKSILEVDMNKLPVGAAPGHVLNIDEDSIVIDTVATEVRAGRIKKKMERVWE